jgi:hypothetical protein
MLCCRIHMVAQKASSPGDRARRFMTVATNTLASGAGRVRWCTLNDTEHSLLPRTVLFDGEEVEAPKLAVGDCQPENFSVSYLHPVCITFTGVQGVPKYERPVGLHLRRRLLRTSKAM